MFFFHHTSRETARFGSTTRPSTLCGRAAMAASTSDTQEYVTKPKPRDRLFPGSRITCTEMQSVKGYSPDIAMSVPLQKYCYTIQKGVKS